jgi:hypothetical protein
LMFGYERREEHALCFEQKGDFFGVFIDGELTTGDAHRSASAGTGLEFFELSDLLVISVQAGLFGESRVRDGVVSSAPGVMFAATLGLGGYPSRRKALANELLSWSLRLETRRTIEDAPISTVLGMVQLNWFGTLFAI